MGCDAAEPRHEKLRAPTRRLRFTKAALIASLLATALAATAAPAFASPLAPTNLKITETSESAVALSWTAPSSGEAPTGYEVLRNGEAAGPPTDSYTTNFLDTGRSKGTLYTYKVVALATKNRSPASEEVSAETAGSSEAITECHPGSLGSGHYVLTGNLLLKPGLSQCLKFEAKEHISLDCQEHSIINEMGAENNAPALNLVSAKHFLIVNCRFDNPDPVHNPCCLVEVDEPRLDNTSQHSEAGLFEDDEFVTGQENEWVETLDTKGVAFNSDVFVNAPVKQWTGQQDYFGHNTGTLPSQGRRQGGNDIFWLGRQGSANVVDANSFDGDSDLKGYPSSAHWYEGPVYGSDDVLGSAETETEDAIVNNQIDNVFDCGIEGSPIISTRIANNSFANNWAAGVCAYGTSWKNDTIAGNTVAHSGTLFTFNGLEEVNPGQYFYGNTFENNSLSSWEWHIWDYAAYISQWQYQNSTTVGHNTFKGNNFGPTAPAPLFDAKGATYQVSPPEYPELVAPLIVTEQASNKCKTPSPYLSCATPTEPAQQAPHVVALYPTQGPLAGGTTVAIEGSGFTGASKVYFGGEPATITSKLQDSRLVVTAPHGSAGPANVTVVTPAGTSEVLSGTWPRSATDQFTYGNFPEVTALAPAQGAKAGGTSVTISGSGLSGATEVDFGTTVERSCTRSGPPCFRVQSNGSIMATSAPESVPGEYVNVTVTTPVGTSPVGEGITMEPSSAVNDTFTYVAPPTVAPTVAKVEPNSGQEGGGTAVTITGTHFESVEGVSFGTKSAKSFVVKSPTSITAVSPPGAGTVDVTVTTPAGSSVSAAGDKFTFGPALTFGWGENGAGELAGGAGKVTVPLPIATSELPGVTAFAAGDADALGLVEGGRVLAWGSDAEGQLGNGSIEAVQESPVPVCSSAAAGGCAARLEEVSAISAGEAHNLALLKSGKVMSWGKNTEGQLGTGSTTSSDLPTEVTGLPEKAIAVSAGEDHSLALLASGKVWAWGNNEHGQLGDNTTANSDVPMEVKGLPEKAIAVAAGYRHSLALLQSGKVWAWGDDEKGELGNGAEGEKLYSAVPVEVQGLGGVSAISAGWEYSLALVSGGTVESWGSNAFATLGVSGVSSSDTPKQVQELNNVTAISAGTFHALALLQTGQVKAWGDNTFGELGDGISGNVGNGDHGGPESCALFLGCSRKPVTVKELPAATIIAAGARYNLAARRPPSQTGSIGSGYPLTAVSCIPSTTDCVVTNNKGSEFYATNVSTSSEATWNTWKGPAGSPSEAVACPTTSVCLLANGTNNGEGGNLYYATALGGEWKLAYEPTYGVDAISCASASFCVDGQDNYSYYRYSTNPASTGWNLERQAETARAMTGVFCLSSSFCAISDSIGDVHVATTTSQIESSSWTETTNVDGSTPLHGIACASTTSCVAVDGAGNVLNLAISSEGKATASKQHIDGTNDLTAVTCTGSTCVAVDGAGNIFVSTNSGQSWSKQYSLGDSLSSVSCASTTMCLAADTTGNTTAFDPS